MTTNTVSVDGLSLFIKEQLLLGKSVSFIISGNSMSPMLIDKRDIVHIVPSRDVRKGDVIFFTRDDGSCVLHRVYTIKKNILYVVGDNQRILEEVTIDKVIGKMDSFVRKDKQYTTKSLEYMMYTALWTSSLRLRKLYYKIISLFIGRKK